jgi:hypothetical protein
VGKGPLRYRRQHVGHEELLIGMKKRGETKRLLGTRNTCPVG